MTLATAALPADLAAPVIELAVLSAGFALKHYVADFVLQTNWIARGKERERGWVAPLCAHVLCHGVLTLAIALLVAPHLWWLALIDLAIHFCVDRGKTTLCGWGRWLPTQPQFWWVLGLDQLLHQITNIALATALVVM